MTWVKAQNVYVISDLDAPLLQHFQVQELPIN